MKICRKEIDNVATFKEINDYVDNLLSQNLYTPGSPNLFKNGGEYSLAGVPLALKGFDLFVTAHWMRNIARELFGTINSKDALSLGQGSILKSKGFQFVASQFFLASQNSTDLEVGGLLNATWNPLSLPVAALPFTRPTSFTAVTLGPVFGQTYDSKASRIDKYIDAAKKPAFINDPTLGGGVPEFVFKGSPGAKLASLFIHKKTGFEEVKDRVVGPFKLPKRPTDTPEIVDARFYPYETRDITTGQTDAVVYDEPIPDNENYMPFMFQDLRDNPESFLYFRAFIKPDSLTETFNVDWNPTRYYGRVEQIPIYMGTTRNVGLAFDLVAWQPADLDVIYRKLHKLQSMVYPAFDTKGFLQAGPIIRMRVGNLIAGANKRGLSGYLQSLDFAYDNVWSIEDGAKVPRHITVTLTFTALHEGNPGIYPFKEVAFDNAGEQLEKPSESDRSRFGIRISETSESGVGHTIDEQGIRGTDLIKDHSWRHKNEESEPAKPAGG